MAIAFTNLGASSGLGENNATNPDINSNTDATSYANSSWTPPTSGLIIVFVQSRRGAGPDTPTMSGNSLTWTQIGGTLNFTNGYGLSLFAAAASSSSTGATTISFGSNTQVHCIASFFQATGVDLSGGVAAAFVQSPTATGSATSGSVTLAAAGAAGNRPISAFAHAANETATERTNWVEADDMHGTLSSHHLITQWREDAFETTASGSWATSQIWGGIAAELKAEVAGGGLPIPVAMHTYRRRRIS